MPRLLLNNYSKLGISNLEMILIIHLLSLMPSESSLIQINEIAHKMEITQEELFTLMNSLESKGILSTSSEHCSTLENTAVQSVSIEGLFEKLLELWGCEKAKAYEKKHQPPGQDPRKVPGNSRVISNLYHCFEKEFGRPLSPIESTQVMEWYYGDKYSFELIVEALKRAVLRGVVNFKYIDSILRGWSKNNIKTVKAVIAFEEAFTESKKVKKKNSTDNDADDLDKKYKDIYLT